MNVGALLKGRLFIVLVDGILILTYATLTNINVALITQFYCY